MAQNKFALLIACNEYLDPDFKQLLAPAQDAENFARILKDPSIGNFNVELILNQPAHKATRSIEAFFSERSRDDLMLLYLSCHGVKDERGQLYFATTDTERKYLRTSSIPASFVNEIMRDSSSRRQILLLDSCYSGAFARGMVAKSDKSMGIRERFEGRGRVVITASDAMQYAYEGNRVTGEGVRSVFTSALINGLETGKADLDKDGYISLNELYDYVYETVIAEMPEQKPGKWAFDLQGEILVAENPRRLYPEMIQIPMGEFLMGSNLRNDSLMRDDEAPQHLVDLPSIMISKTPITNTQYATFVEATNHRRPLQWGGDKFPRGREEHPVVTVSLFDAQAYCKWISDLTGKRFVLPSEAEWEKSARGTDGRIYPWGNKWNPQLCNTYESGKMDTVSVFSFPNAASPYGVLDMAGNIWEWTRSVFKNYPYVSDDGRENQQTEGGRVMRGCPYGLDQSLSRVAARGWFDPRGRPVNPNLRTYDLGFRVTQLIGDV